MMSTEEVKAVTQQLSSGTNPQQPTKKTSKFIDEEDLEESLLPEVIVPKKKKQLFDLSNTSAMTELHQSAWKPPRHHSYETMALADSQLNCKIRPCGFRPSGKMRKIRNTCLLAKIKTQCRLKNKNPKLAVCITMYNEDEIELRNTLTGVIHNYNELRTDPLLDFKKEDFVIFIICDGYDKIPESFRQYATDKGFFDEQLLQDKGFMDQNRDKKWKMKDMRDIMEPDAKKVPLNIIHMFQVCTWDFGLQEDILKGRRVNLIFSVKQRNDGKINSHRWFFQGICKYLKPEFCLMLDIGTRPEKHSVYKLYKYMVKHRNCGGCCGEIEVDFSQDKGISSSYFIKAAQFFEYKMGHTPDKANESFFGFNSVLPGAYSMFRWKAIKGEPLDEFFKNITRTDNPSCAEANEFLAEDRVMCLQIYIKKNSGYYLTYVPDAKAYTDAPDNLAVLIKQRRRWMNGALFGSMKVISNFTHMVSCRRTRHPVRRQIGMVFFLIYNTVTFLFQFFTVGSMYASITIFLEQQVGKIIEQSAAADTFFGKLGESGVLSSFFAYFYIALIVMALIVSLTTPVDRGIGYFSFLMGMFGFLLLLTMSGVIFYLTQTGFMPREKQYNQNTHEWEYIGEDRNFSLLMLAGVVMCGVFIIPMILRPFDFLSNFRNYIVGLFSYLFMMPTFINIMQIYAMCNLHDISWGNRPTQGVEAVTYNIAVQQKLMQDYQVFRAHFLYIWLVLNACFGIVMSTIVTGQTVQTLNVSYTFLDGFAMFVASLVVFKFVFAALYQIKWNFRLCCKPYYRKNKVDVAEEFKKMKKDKNAGFSSDEDEFVDENNNDVEPERVKALQKSHIDSDDDDMEFEDAEQEEEEDRLVESVRKMVSNTSLRKYSNNFHISKKAHIESVLSLDHDSPHLDLINKINANKMNKDKSTSETSFANPNFGVVGYQRNAHLSSNDVAGQRKVSDISDVPAQNKNTFTISQAMDASEVHRKHTNTSMGKSVRFQFGGDSEQQVPSKSQHNLKESINEFSETDNEEGSNN